MSETIKKLTIEGYKSIRKLEDFERRLLNVLIGANGAGKSNFVSFFRLLRELVGQRLQLALQASEGGADGLPYMGSISAYTGDGVLFTVDTRLRPNCRDGEKPRDAIVDSDIMPHVRGAERHS